MIITYDIYCIITNIFGFVNIYFANCCPFCAKNRYFNEKNGKSGEIAAMHLRPEYGKTLKQRHRILQQLRRAGPCGPRRAPPAPASRLAALTQAGLPGVRSACGAAYRFRSFSHLRPCKCRIPLYSPRRTSYGAKQPPVLLKCKTSGRACIDKCNCIRL